MKKLRAIFPFVLIFGLALICVDCVSTRQVGQLEPRTGDEIVAAGQFFHTGTKVVLWMDPGGYDAYRVERRFSPFDKSSWEISHSNNPSLTPNRYGLRRVPFTAEQLEQVRGGGWDLPLLQSVVDQFVMHFDVAGTSRRCFEILQDDRCLSVHFLLDVDGTIYQTLDLKERAWHATTSNDRSIGIEIANVGAYDVNGKNPLAEWYQVTNGETILTIPARYNDTELRQPGFVARPARPQPVYGNIQGEDLMQYDFTPEQYQALIKLTAAVCKVFPKIKCRYPTDADGKLIPHKLPDDDLKNYEGIIGHYHIQTNKVDPGPAFQWDYVITNAQKILDAEKFQPLLSPHAAAATGVK
jgi:N-acetyl-anhydromuramyl-L-alanine amidase AmpD